MSLRTIKIFIGLFLVAYQTVYSVHAQKIKKEDYFLIDSLAQSCGAMEGASLSFIVDSMARHCHTELEMTRAFYYWETHFIAFDSRRLRHPQNFPDNASSALNERKAASKGYAEMFKAMCTLKGISCEVVKGLIRRDERDIGQLNADAIHYWNVITINNTRYLIDASMGGGELDRKLKFFYPKYTDAWWLGNRSIFLLSHFPDKAEMQLQQVPIKKFEFSRGPIASAQAIVSGLIATQQGLIRGIEDSSIILKFNFAGQLSVPSMSVSYDNAPRTPAQFDLDAYGVYLKLRFPKPGSYYVHIYVGSSLAYTFKAKVRKGRHNRQLNLRN